MKNLIFFVTLAIAGLSAAQTPPIQPQTPDVKVPGPLVLPAPKEIEIGSQPLSLQEAISLALRKQPQINIARADVQGARGRTQQSASGLLPQFSASAGFSRTSDIRGNGTGTGNSLSSSVNVSQLLFDFGRTRDQLKQQQALQRATEHSLTQSTVSLTVQVKQAYYNLVEDRALVGIAESNLANRQRQLDQAQARLNAGLGPPSDVIQAKTNFADGAISLSSARNTALSSQIGLAQLLGIDPRTPITPVASAESPVDGETDLEQLVTAALAQRPDVKAAQERVNASRYAINAAQKGNLPRVSASAGVAGRGSNDPLETQNGTFGINLSWSFGDGGLTSGRIKEARAGEEVARQELISMSQQVVADVGLAYLDLQTALQRVELAKVEVANALELVRISEGRFTGGIGTFLEVTNAQNSLYAAQRNLTQSQQDVERARARLRAATGVS